jgi:hypothetical protein
MRGTRALLAASLLVSRASPQVVLSTFTLVGNGLGPASATASSLTITPAVNSIANAAWSPAPVDVTTAFALTFSITMSATTGADGVALVFHNDARGRAAYGAPGGALGALGILPGAMVAFRTYQTFAPGYYGGPTLLTATTTLPSVPLAPISTAPTFFRVVYSPCIAGGQLTWSSATQVGTVAMNLSAAVGNRSSAIWGFSGGTGGINAVHTISGVTMTPYADACGSGLVDFTTLHLVTGAGSTPPSATAAALTIEPPAANVANAAWAPISLDLLSSFSVTFTLSQPAAAPADGVALVFHADPRGRAASGASGGSLGAFYSSTQAPIFPGYAFTVRDYQSGSTGFYGGPASIGAATTALPSLRLGTALTTPLSVSVAYSPCGGGTLTWATSQYGVAPYAYNGNVAVNLSAALGGARYATWGWTAGSGSVFSAHTISRATFQTCAAACGARAVDFSNWNVVGYASAVASAPSVCGAALTITNSALNQAMAAWSPTPLDVSAAFVISFTVTLSANVSVGADGFALVLHNDFRGAAALGGSGGSIGAYGSISPSFGFAVKDYQQTAPGYRVALDTFQSATAGSIGPIVSTGSTPPAPMSVTLSYNPCTCTMSYATLTADGSRSAGATNVSLVGWLGIGRRTARWGFTGGSGGAVFTHTITNLTVTSAPPACAAALWSNWSAVGTAATCPATGTAVLTVGNPGTIAYTPPAGFSNPCFGGPCFSAGALWGPSQLSTRSAFSIAFTANIGTDGLKGGLGADGFAVLLHADARGRAALGSTGGNVGVWAGANSVSPSVRFFFLFMCAAAPTTATLATLTTNPARAPRPLTNRLAFL